MMHINILGTFIVLFIRLNDVSSQRRQCLGSSNYCPGQFGGMASICRDGFCVCTGKDYNYNTCLRKLFYLVLIIYSKFTIY